MSPFSVAERELASRVGLGHAAVASDAAPEPHRRQPRTDVAAPGPLDTPLAPTRGAPDIPLCTSDPCRTSLPTELTAPRHAKRPRTLMWGCPTAPRDQFSTRSTGISIILMTCS